MFEPLFDVDDLEKYLPVKSGITERISDYVRMVDSISFDTECGETFALIGEPGSGKSTVARTIIGLTGATGGTVRFDGEDITSAADERLARLRLHVQTVFQDPTSSLNPRRTIGKSLMAPLRTRGVATSNLRERMVDSLEHVELNDEYWNKYPHEFSGGQKQRVSTARVLVVESELPLLDEPASALDVSVQAEITALLEDLQVEFGLTYLLITHDPSPVRNFVDETAVMYLGGIQERGSTQEVFQRSRHPYSRALPSVIPVMIDEEEACKPRHEPLRGETPSPRDAPMGCRFYTRCPYTTDTCSADGPAFVVADAGPSVRCHIYDEAHADVFDDMPKVAAAAVADEGVASNQEP